MNCVIFGVMIIYYMIYGVVFYSNKCCLIILFI